MEKNKTVYGYRYTKNDLFTESPSIYIILDEMKTRCAIRTNIKFDIIDKVDLMSYRYESEDPELYKNFISIDKKIHQDTKNRIRLEILKNFIKENEKSE